MLNLLFINRYYNIEEGGDYNEKIKLRTDFEIG